MTAEQAAQQANADRNAIELALRSGEALNILEQTVDTQEALDVEIVIVDTVNGPQPQAKFDAYVPSAFGNPELTPMGTTEIDGRKVYALGTQEEAKILVTNMFIHQPELDALIPKYEELTAKRDKLTAELKANPSDAKRDEREAVREDLRNRFHIRMLRVVTHKGRKKMVQRYYTVSLDLSDKDNRRAMSQGKRMERNGTLLKWGYEASNTSADTVVLTPST